MLRVAFRTAAFRATAKPTLTPAFVRMSSSKPAHLNKMFVLEKSAETISQYSEFRRVLWTGEHSQLVCMTVPVGGEIGEEIHTRDQVLTFTSGSAKAIVNGEERHVGAGDIVIVPAGCKHNFITTSGTPLILFTVYAPAEHNDKTIHKTKEEGDALEEAGKDEPPEWALKYEKK